MFKEGDKVILDSTTQGIIKEIVYDPQGISEPLYLIKIKDEQKEKTKICRGKRLTSLVQWRQDKLDELNNLE